MSNGELLRLYCGALDQLKDRGVLRTNDNPTGGYAEWLFCRALDLEQQPNSAYGYDAVAADGTRVQIKGRRRRTGQPVYRPLGFMRNLHAEQPPFDVLAAVIFDSDYTIAVAVTVPLAVVQEYASYVEHVNGWRLRITQTLLDDPRVTTVTEALRAAATQPSPGEDV